MATAAAEAAAVATAAAAGAFKYNRGNYMFDMGQRWGRFNTGYSMAMAQASMYREDIRDLTLLTVTKQDTYHTVGTIFFVLNFQLIMAGRLGVHGPSPPGWLLGLYWTNICSALMFLVTFTWMAMHAAARATAGGAYMLTRSVRLPIPTPKMLDKARKTGNSYEKERVVDVFRVPFVAPARKESVEDPETGSREVIGDRRMPQWYHDEVKELRQDEGGPAAGSNPEHFELYRGLQEEWWAHDVYSRIGVLYFMSHWLTSASLYSMCHIFTELRCVWPAYTVTACFVLAHRAILQLDIVNKKVDGATKGVPVEKVVPFVPFLCVVGMTVDYSVLSPAWTAQAFIYALSWVAYVIQFAWAIRLYDLAAPKAQLAEREEVPGQAWWPVEWPLPPAFQDALYMVSAPKSVDQPCLQQEMKAAKGKAAHEVPQKKARRAPPPMLVWKLFRGALITTISMWVLIMVGRAFEHVNGERWLLKQENRVERWPSHYQPWMPPWSRKGSRNEWCHAGGCDRRLSAAEVEQQQEFSEMAQRLATNLRPIAQALGTFSTTPTPPHEPVAPLRHAQVQWPIGFEPTLSAARGNAVVALAPTSGGAMVQLRGDATVESVAPFALRGIEGLGAIAGMAWDADGLVLATATGAIAECAGQPHDGVWACARLAAPALPGGLAAVAAGRHPASGRVRAAVAFAGDEVGVLMLEADMELGAWLPAGEIQAPAAVSHLALAPSGEELLISTVDGRVFKRSIEGSQEATVVALPRAVPGAAWRSACGLGGGRVARVAAPVAGGAARLFVSPAAAASA